MARVLTCPRCGKTHVGATHTQGSLSAVCTTCVPILAVVTPADAAGRSDRTPAARHKRKKVSK